MVLRMDLLPVIGDIIYHVGKVIYSHDILQNQFGHYK